MKIKTPFLIVFGIFFLFSVVLKAQSSISLSTGISSDLNNAHHSFYHIPFSLQWKPSTRKRAAFFVEFDYDFPVSTKSSGQAYTLNPSLPKEVTLKETVHPYIFSASIGFKIHIYTNKKNNSFYLNLLPIGYSFQNIKVSYKNFDKENYEILNPDVSLKRGGFVNAFEAEYNFHNTKQDMKLMIHIQSPPLRKTGDYPLSYKFVAPLQLTFGYNFYYNKRK
jgi:hypothetical protein